LRTNLAHWIDRALTLVSLAAILRPGRDARRTSAEKASDARDPIVDDAPRAVAPKGGPLTHAFGASVALREIARRRAGSLHGDVELDVLERAGEALRTSEATLRAILDSADRGILLIDRDGNVGAFNRRAGELFGRISSRPLRVGERFASALDAERYHRMIAPYVAEALAGRTVRVEARTRTRDGGTHWYEYEAVPVRAQDDDIIGVCLSAAEIDERKRSQDAVAEAAAVSSALVRVGRELIGSLASGSFLHRLCVITAEVLGCDMSHTLMLLPDGDAFVPIASEDDSADRREALALVRVPRSVVGEMLRRLEHDDVVSVGEIPASIAPSLPTLADYESLCMALRCGDEIIGLQTAQRVRSGTPFTHAQHEIARGIAQLASLALNHARTVEELEQANRIKSDFVATMSHELRTPLHVILGYADLLLAGEFGPLNVRQGETLDRLLRRAHELHELIVSTLDVSRLDSGRAVLHVEEVALAELIETVEAESRRWVAGAKPELVVRIAPDLPVVRTDGAKLKVVLKNLLSNAFKFTERGTVAIDARPAPGGVAIAVSDTGIGIAPDVLPTLFQPFRQGDPSPSRRYSGVGLGLYIARRLLDILGGEIAVESEPGGGSTFTVRLPLDARARDDAAASDAVATATE